MTEEQDRPPAQSTSAGEDVAWERGLRHAFGDDTVVASSPSPGGRLRVRPLPESAAPLLKPGRAEFGETFGRYHVDGEIARGGVGVVLQVKDRSLGRDVAMKVLARKHQPSDLLVERFVEEAQIGGQLQHPGIVPVYELGQDESGRPFFTMKLVEGRTLSALLRERKHLDTDRARFLRIFEQVCQTMAYAHARGVVHRDLKPSNIMVGAFGEVQILDWGFAKVLGRGGIEDERSARADAAIRTVRSGPDGSESISGAAVGTPAYMSPEQALGNVEALDERTDVFCLGAVLCETLTGRPPYVADGAVAILKDAAAAAQEGCHARLVDCGADAELIGLAMDCLRPAKGARPHDASEVAGRVSAYLASVEERARTAEVQAAEERTRAAGERKTRRWAVSLAGLVLVVLCAGVWLLWRHGEDRRQNEASVQSALAEAAGAAGKSDWAAAIGATLRARDLAHAAPTSAEVRERVAERLDLYTRAQKKAALLRSIDEIRAQQDLTPKNSAARYAAAFKAYGIDVLSSSAEEVGARLQEEGKEMAGRLALMLDDWASRIPPNRRGEQALWKKLVEAANAADPDVWRYRLRRATLSNDRKLLAELVESLKQEKRPPESIILLAQALHRQRTPKSRDAELRALLEGYRQDPGDFWINFSLAQRTTLMRPPRGRGPGPGPGGPRGPGGRRERGRGQLDLALRHARIAVALRPRNPEARALLGTALRRRAEGRRARPDDAKESVEHFREAMTLARDGLLARSCEAAVLYGEGEEEGAHALAEELTRRHGGLPPHIRAILEPILR